jgi:hypothetical protein
MHQAPSALGVVGVRERAIVAQREPTEHESDDRHAGTRAEESEAGAHRHAPRTRRLCGPTVERPGERYGILLRHGSLASIHDAVVLGFDASVDVRGGTTQLTFDHAIFGGQRIGALAYAERSDAEAQELDDDDEGFDELEAFVAVGTLGPAVDCASIPALLPTAEQRAQAIAPPDDGFFDDGAVFIGALRGPEDDWLDAGWLGW